MAGLIKAAMLFNIVVVRGSVFREEKFLQDANHIEHYESSYSDYSSDDFGNAFDDFDGQTFMPGYQQHHFYHRKLVPDWFSPEFREPIGPAADWLVTDDQGKIGYPARRYPDNNKWKAMCQNVKGLPSPDSGCCGVEVTRSSVHQQHPDYPSMPFWPGFGDQRHRRSINNEKPPNKMIRGGRATDLRQLPWTVRLAINPRIKGLHSPHYCGGTIISSLYVLTAAHCLHNTFKDISQLEVYVAEYDTDTYPEDCIRSHGQTECIQNIVRKVDHVILHKDYDDTYLQNDVALLRLSSDLPYTEFIRPICLPTSDISDLQEENIIIAGWGLDGKKETNVKQAANVNFVSNEKCKQQYDYKDESLFCSIGDHGEDICHGDSGGPLMVVSANKYFLAGVVSGKRGDHECGSSVSSLFNNVFYHKDWIVKNVQ